jgi:hypothetical protein
VASEAKRVRQARSRGSWRKPLTNTLRALGELVVFLAGVYFRWMPAAVALCLSALAALVAYVTILGAKQLPELAVSDIVNLSSVSAVLLWTLGQAYFGRAQLAPDKSLERSRLVRVGDKLTHAGYRWLITWCLAFAHRTMNSPSYFGTDPVGILWVLKQVASLAGGLALLSGLLAFTLTISGIISLEQALVTPRPPKAPVGPEGETVG